MTAMLLFPGVRQHRRKFAAYVPAGISGRRLYLGIFAFAGDANQAARAARAARGLPEPRRYVRSACT